MWQPGRPFREAYQRPIDAGIENGRIVFFIHGGLNDQPGVVARIKRFANQELDGFEGQPWHLIHLAWDTSWGSAIDDIIGRLNSWRSWRNILRLGSLLLPWNWFGWRRGLKSPTAHFGSIIWRSEYDTAVAATSAVGPRGLDRDGGFFRAIEYLSQRVAEGSDVQVSFVVHSAGAIVSNYILRLIEVQFPNLSSKVRDYILLAPACHLTHMQEALGATQPTGHTAVFTLSPELELEDNIGVYDKSLLWAIYDLFEARWKEKDFRRYELPFDSSLPADDLRNRGLLGIEEQIARVENNPTTLFSRSFGVGVAWAYTDADTSLGTFPKRVWTTSRTHGAFDDDRATLESVRVLLT